MSVTLRQTRSADQRISLRGLTPERLAALSTAEITRQRLDIGNRHYPLGEFFEVSTDDSETDTLTLHTIDDRIDHIGSGMSGGQVHIHGKAGNWTGAGMRAGSIDVDGSAGDYSGSGMIGGRLSIRGDSGRHAGAPAAGERRGQQGGVIHVTGDAGAFAGERMRRGMLLVEGDCGDCLGHRMIAGTIYCAGSVGELAGYGMRRGTLLLREAPSGLPGTLADNGRQPMHFLPLLLRELTRYLSKDSGPALPADGVHRFVGDLACDGRGEILVIA